MADNVRVGNRYILRPVGLDASDTRVTGWTGHEVRVVRGPGVGAMPKPFAYVEDVETFAFIGLVNRASLQLRPKKGA